MTPKGFSLLVFIWLSLLTNNLVRGRYTPMDEDQTYKKNTTFLYTKSNKTIAPCKGWLKKKPPSSYYEDIAIHWATMRSTIASYYGVTAAFTAYGLPTVLEGQSTETSVLVVNNAAGSLHTNEIQAGWNVEPGLYGHTDTRFFVRWTRDGYNSTGCVNLQCEGFVVDNSSALSPGDPLHPLSTFKGQQWVLNLTISKDEETADWWLYYGKNGVNHPIGYWPSSLFTTLQDSAQYIYVGGAVTFEKGIYSPPMGSGHFPDQGPGKAAFINGIQLIDKSGQHYQVQDGNFDFYHTEDDCYNIAGDVRGYLYYGGPGGCIN